MLIAIFLYIMDVFLYIGIEENGYQYNIVNDVALKILGTVTNDDPGQFFLNFQ